MIYFLGIGGIGMSALARYCKAIGEEVCGYDRTPSPLTKQLEAEGIRITYTDQRSEVINLKPEEVTVVYTPAIPASNAIRQFFEQNSFNMIKRAKMLGMLCDKKDSICISGTHGKTTTSTMAAHILRQSQVGCSAFLGGISVNYDTNYWDNKTSPYVVTEADEFDRSFLHLHPFVSVITAMDADHLDIYGTHEEMCKAFHKYASQTSCGGSLIYKYGIKFDEDVVNEDAEVFTYSLSNSKADFYASNIKLTPEGLYTFRFNSPMGNIDGLKLGMPGLHNIENAVAAIACCQLTGEVEDHEIIDAVASFRGNKRRFEYYIRKADRVLIDDYAHHPAEIATTLRSAREIYANRKLTVCFQPHLFTRTRDFAKEFAEALSKADRLILLPIYPAREQPIEGIDSNMLAALAKQCNPSLNVSIAEKENLAATLKAENPDVTIIMGAGDIDRLLPQIQESLQ